MNTCHVPQQSAIPSLSTTLDTPQQPNTPQTAQPPTQSQPWPVSVSLAGFFSSARTSPPSVSMRKPINLQLQPSLQPSLQNLNAMQAGGPRPAVPPQQQQFEA
ncbi:hypothetical protein MDA_GLEAN10001072 [Myotis davidii]|uniref:CREB-binding protein n=1 Tax=Myotis davidii TaxID=225400 RepID=L5MEH4_MYODS|nr:hypothetical protein MDA_GLEAN10001072 [Myotis davidii]